jgi:hypothetical protein
MGPEERHYAFEVGHPREFDGHPTPRALSHGHNDPSVQTTGQAFREGLQPRRAARRTAAALAGLVRGQTTHGHDFLNSPNGQTLGDDSRGKLRHRLLVR